MGGDAVTLCHSFPYREAIRWVATQLPSVIHVQACPSGSLSTRQLEALRSEVSERSICAASAKSSTCAQTQIFCKNVSVIWNPAELRLPPTQRLSP